MYIHHDPQIYLATQLFSIVCTYVYCVYVFNVFKKKLIQFMILLYVHMKAPWLQSPVPNVKSSEI